MKRKVIIRAQGSVIYGIVISAANWGTADKPNWYIEYEIDTDKSSRPARFGGNYGYYKQQLDGGTVEFTD